MSVKIKEFSINIIRRGEDVTRIVTEKMDLRFDMTDFDRSMEEGRVGVPQAEPLKMGTLRPKNGILTQKGGVSVTKGAEPKMMPGVRRDGFTIFNGFNFSLQIGDFLINGLKTCSSPRNKIRTSSNNGVMEGVHRRSIIQRIKSFSNTRITAVIIKPKVIESKDRLLGRNRRMSSEE